MATGAVRTDRWHRKFRAEPRSKTSFGNRAAMIRLGISG
jgi:hypothetical protein